MSPSCESIDAEINALIDASTEAGAASAQWRQLESHPHVMSCQRCQQSLRLWTRIDANLSKASLARMANSEMAPIDQTDPFDLSESPARRIRRNPVRTQLALLAASLVAVLGWSIADGRTTRLNSSARNPPPSSPSNPSSATLAETSSKPLAASSPMMAIASSPQWIRHWVRSADFPLVVNDLWPGADDWTDHWSDVTTPTLIRLSTGIDPIQRTFVGVARSFTGVPMTMSAGSTGGRTIAPASDRHQPTRLRPSQIDSDIREPGLQTRLAVDVVAPT